MHITTVHSLVLTMRCANNEQHMAAIAIIRGGHESMQMDHLELMPQKLEDGADPATRGTQITVQSSDRDKCEHYWIEVQRALAFIGVEVTSP